MPVMVRHAHNKMLTLFMTIAQNITVVRVPAYSPYAVAEHAAGLMLTLNRHIHKYRYHILLQLDANSKTFH